MGLHFKMQILFDELHKRVLPPTRREKNLPFKANCGIKVCMKERKMALAIKTSFVMQTHFSWKQ